MHCYTMHLISNTCQNIVVKGRIGSVHVNTTLHLLTIYAGYDTTTSLLPCGTSSACIRNWLVVIAAAQSSHHPSHLYLPV